MATVYIQKECGDVRHARLNNNTGADLEQYELTVINGIVLVADEAIANGEVGSFTIDDSYSIQVSDLVATEDTFGTVNADVFWDPTSGDFSDTSTIGYYPVGIVQEIKNSNGVVLVLINRDTVIVA